MIRLRFAAFLLLTILLFTLFPQTAAFPAEAAPESTAITWTFYANRDTYIDEISNIAQGNNDSLFVKASAIRQRALMGFDISDLPSNAIIQSATLELTANTISTTNGFTVRADAITSSWDEATTIWSNSPSTAYYNDPTVMLSAGAGVKSWDVTNIVNEWRGGLTNHGIMLRSTSSLEAGTADFVSSESTSYDQRPHLVITFTTETTPLFLEPDMDTYVDEGVPSTNYGNDNVLRMSDLTNDKRYTLLHFDTSELPSDVTITSATLEMFFVINYLSEEGAAAPDASLAPTAPAIRAEAIVNGWTEFGATWNNRPASSYRNDPPGDYSLVGWDSYDVSNIVQDWVDGTVENYGILLKVVPGQGQTATYHSNDYGSGFFYSRTSPRLTITYEPSPPDCEPISSMVINGPTEAVAGVSYTYDATISRVDASGPFSYTWTSPGQPTYDTPTAEYSWDTAGSKTVSLTVENCGGTSSNNRTTVVSDPAPACPNPMTGMVIAGPNEAQVNQTVPLNILVEPIEATAPFTYTWQATGFAGTNTSTTDLYYDGRIYNWTGSGPVEVTVTAENCGGKFTRRHLVNVISSSALPDLSISSAWYDPGLGEVGYVMHNNGGMAAPAGHQTILFQNSDDLADQIVNESIPANGVRAYSFNHIWSCAGNNAAVTLRADADADVDEGNEGNNQYNDTWKCDLVPPVINSGPTVSNITETAAQVSWNTNETTSGRVEYGETGYASYSADTDSNGTSHTINLTGLQPGTVYRVRVFATDTRNNTSNTDWIFFETNPPGSDPPAFTELTVSQVPGSPYEAYSIQAAFADATYLERVEFFLEGVHVGTQYYSFLDRTFQTISPQALGYDRATFYDAAGLEIEAVAYSTGGNTSAETITHVFDDPGQPIQLAILTPAPEAELIFDGATAPAGTNVNVVVWAQQYDWRCTTDGRTYGNYPGLRCADANPRPVTQMRLSLSNNVVGTYTPAANEYLHLFDVDLEGLSALLRPLTLRATGDDGHFEEVSQPYIMAQGVPLLEFDRSVTHVGSLYTIELTIRNVGSGTATIKQVRDLLHGFVAIDKSTNPARESSGYYNVSSTYDTWWTGSALPNVIIDFTSAEIPPDDSFTVTYEAVPIIYESGFVDAYHIGHDEEGHRSDILYTYEGSSFNTLLPFSAPGNMVYEPLLGQSTPLFNAVLFYTFPTSDYLLVTSPPRLSAATSNAEQIPGLMSDLAKLAKETNAIIAHAGLNPTAQAVDDLLEPGGYWYTMMHPNFREVLGGYVLFIGEDEIIPTQGGGWGVDFSDLRYASTGGAARPELVLGRITGDNIANMRKPIQAATIFHRNGSTFDSSHALLWSGSGDGEGTFWNDTKAMSSILVDTGASYSRFRSSDYESEVDLRPLLYQNSAGKDWIIYRGHGYRQGFADIGEHAIHVNTTNNLNMSPNRPIVLALACTTGDFVNGDDDWSINESFLANGAAVFLGSTETSSRARNSSAARGIFNRWHSGRSIGIVMARLMRDKWGDSSWTWPDDATWERWIYDYQIFGDPKYGEGVSDLDQDPITIQAGDQYLLANNALANTLNISLPDLEVSLTDEGWHYVSLPDGDRMALQGEYAVPIFSATYHYPAGQRVQDVTLDMRGGLVISTGLSINLNYFELDDGSLSAAASSSSNTTSADGWYPEMPQPFTWRVFENADGSSDLHLTVYPFSYHPASTDSRFYKEWQFTVETTTSNVMIEGIDVETVADPNDVLPIQLLLSNSGAAQDVIVSATIQSIEGEPLAGLPLKILRDLPSSAAVNLSWDTDSLPADDYMLAITISTLDGEILDEANEVVTLGDPQLGVINLTADDKGNIAYTVTNTGTVAVSGTAVIHIQNEQMETVEMFTHSIANPIAPAASQSYQEQWSSAAAPDGIYYVTVYIKHSGKASAPQQVMVEIGNQLIYLPMILR